MFIPSTLASTAAWVAAYAGTAALSHACSPTYRRLTSPAAKAGWDSRIVSTLHAVLIVALALLGGGRLLADPAAADTLLSLRASPLTTASLGISAGYFLVDLTLVLRHRGLGGPAMVAHHLAALAALAVGGTRDEGHLYTLFLMLAEATTPFVNARYFLDATGRRAHWTYIANGLALTASWGLIRVLGFACFFAHLATHWSDVAALSPLCRGLLTTVPALFYGLNLYWFSLLVRGAVKVLGGGGGGGRGQRAGSRGGSAPSPPSKLAPDASPAVQVEAGRGGGAAGGLPSAVRRSTSPVTRRVSFSDSPPPNKPLTRARAAAPKPSALAGRAVGPVEVPRWWAAGLLPGRLGAAWA